MYPWHFYTVFNFHSEVIISFSFHLYIIQTNFFRIRILLFTSNYVISLNITLLHFQLSSATNINFDLHLRFNFKFQLQTSNLNFNFTRHFQTSTSIFLQHHMSMSNLIFELQFQSAFSHLSFKF